MRREDFRRRWSGDLWRYRLDLLEGSGLSQESQAWLVEVGVPAVETRGLSFLNPAAFTYTPWFEDAPEDDAELAGLIHIATDIGGDYLCISPRENDAVLLLCHESEDWRPIVRVSDSLPSFYGWLLAGMD